MLVQDVFQKFMFRYCFLKEMYFQNFKLTTKYHYAARGKKKIHFSQMQLILFLKGNKNN